MPPLFSYIQLWFMPALLVTTIIIQYYCYNSGSTPPKREDEYMLLQRYSSPKLIEAIEQNPLKRWYPGSLKRTLDQLYGYDWSITKNQATYPRNTALHTLFTKETDNSPIEPTEGFFAIQLHLNQAENPHHFHIATPPNNNQDHRLLELRYHKSHYTIIPVQ